MDVNDKAFAKLNKTEAMTRAGWGSLNKDKSQLELTIYSAKISVLFDCVDYINFRVFRLGHTTINGNSSHRIEVKPNLQLNLQDPRHYPGKIVLAIVNGKLNEFAFSLRPDQIIELMAHSYDDIKLIAEPSGDCQVKITWIDHGRMVV